MAEFQAELDSCDPRTCTVIKCTVGPLEKDESVLFKVRSRLFTETQVKVSTSYYILLRSVHAIMLYFSFLELC